MSRSIYVWLNRMTCNLIEFDLFPDCYLWEQFEKKQDLISICITFIIDVLTRIIK